MSHALSFAKLYSIFGCLHWSNRWCCMHVIRWRCATVNQTSQTAHILIKKIPCSLAPEAIPDPFQEVCHLPVVLLLQPPLMQLGPLALIPSPVFAMPYQVLLYSVKRSGLTTSAAVYASCIHSCHTAGGCMSDSPYQRDICKEQLSALPMYALSNPPAQLGNSRGCRSDSCLCHAVSDPSYKLWGQ